MEAQRQWEMEILQKNPSSPLKIKALKKSLLKILNDLECDIPSKNVTELSIVLTNNQEIQELNLHFRGKDAATDVLSFSMLEGEGATHATSLGDIVISEEYAAHQAEELGYSFEEEILRLLIHGLLHLCGFEHENVSDEIAAEMFSFQDQLWEKYKAEIEWSK